MYYLACCTYSNHCCERTYYVSYCHHNLLISAISVSCGHQNSRGCKHRTHLKTVGFCVMRPPIQLPCRNQELLIVTLSVSCCHHKSCSARTRHFSYWCFLCHNATKAVAMQESDTSDTGRFCVMLLSNQLQCRNQTLLKLVASVS